MKPVQRLHASFLAFLAVALAGATTCQPQSPPEDDVVVVSQSLALPGFEDVSVATGLTQPTVVKFAANGKMFVGQKDGRIFVYDSVDDTSATLFADLRTQVMNFWDRGLLGLAVDPNYPATPHVFVLYTWDVDSLTGTAPRWNDACADATGNGCVVFARLSRLTDMGSSGPTTSSEQVLLSGWGNQFPSHTIGSLNFGPDGALYLSSGEGANFNAEDWGQWGGNPLGDPPGGSMSPPSARGGALRSQSLRRPTGDPILLQGTILRVDKSNGAHLPDNPLASNPNANAKRIIASGLRNPFRFTIHPTTGELWVGDVGWGTWEEINRLARPAPVENFGWPCWEGSPRQGGYDSANLTICEDLYNTSLHNAPHYAYNHANKIVPGETCTTGSSSISGLAVYNTGSYPTDYQGALFFADYTRKCIWVMKTTNSVPDPAKISNFITSAANPVDLQIGPGGDLFYVDLGGGTVRRVKFRAPNAVATANPTSGPTPLVVNFSGTSSTPGNGGSLTYAWDLDGDGAFDDGTASTATFTYGTQGTYLVRLRVTESGGGVDISDPITITAGPPTGPNDPPVPVVDTPASGTTWIVGTTISFSGHATDTEDGNIPASRLSWDIVMQHCPSDCHPHVIQTFTGVASGSFNAPDHEYPSYLEIKLTATDTGGKTTTVIRRIDPRTVALTFAASPSTTPALQIGFAGASTATPFTRTVIIGSSHALSASGQLRGSTAYEFASWSDGGAASHSIVAPATATTYTATFTGTTWSSQDVGAVGAAGSWTFSGNTYSVTGSGADIWTTVDEFRYLYRNITGDATITAQLTGLPNTNMWAKAGIMIRDGVAANARNVAMLATPTPANAYRFQRRTTAGTATTDAFGGSGAIPVWLRLVRSGNNFSAFHSSNGTSWTQLSTPVTMTLPATIPVGLVVTSHADGTLNTSTFQNVTITQSSPTPPLAPTGLGATAGNTQVSLTWSASASATSYNVKRATISGGPYSNVATGVTATSFTNTGLANGTTYHYVVSAVNSAGESPNSAQASATPTASSTCQSVALSRSSATAASVENAMFPASNAIDASMTTRWSSLFSDPQWIYVDLGASRRVNRVVLTWEAAASANYTVELSSSTSGPWTSLIAVPNGNGGTDDLSFTGGAGRYVRMFSTARTTIYGVSLFDFAVHGDNNPSCTP